MNKENVLEQVTDIEHWVRQYEGDVDRSTLHQCCRDALFAAWSYVRPNSRFPCAALVNGAGALVILDAAECLLGDGHVARSLATEFPRLPGARELKSSEGV